MQPLDRDTLGSAKAYFRSRLREGVDCPCCGRVGLIYRRKFSSDMAEAFLLIYAASRGNTQEYLKVADVLNPGPRRHFGTGGDIAKIRHYGLIVPKPLPRRRKRNWSAERPLRLGLYRVTHDGVAFAQGRRRIRSHFFEAIKLGYSSIDRRAKLVSIQDCLREDFDYVAFMRKLRHRGSGRPRRVLKR